MEDVGKKYVTLLFTFYKIFTHRPYKIVVVVFFFDNFMKLWTKMTVCNHLVSCMLITLHGLRTLGDLKNLKDFYLLWCWIEAAETELSKIKKKIWKCIIIMKWYNHCMKFQFQLVQIIIFLYIFMIYKSVFYKCGLTNYVYCNVLHGTMDYWWGITWISFKYKDLKARRSII